MTKKMTRKRFYKLLMAHGANRNTARDLAECVKLARRAYFIDGFTVEFVNGQKYQRWNVHSTAGIREHAKGWGAACLKHHSGRAGVLYLPPLVCGKNHARAGGAPHPQWAAAQLL